MIRYTLIVVSILQFDESPDLVRFSETESRRRLRIVTKARQQWKRPSIQASIANNMRTICAAFLRIKFVRGSEKEIDAIRHTGGTGQLRRRTYTARQAGSVQQGRRCRRAAFLFCPQPYPRDGTFAAPTTVPPAPLWEHSLSGETAAAPCALSALSPVNLFSGERGRSGSGLWPRSERLRGRGA
jgi:hypothetical protein